MHPKEISFWHLATFVVCLNVVILLTNAPSHLEQLRRPSYIPGRAFFLLRDYLRDIPTIGYYTDKEGILSRTGVLQEYLEAQNALAPTLLVFQNRSFEMIVLNCTTKETAYHLMQQIGASPVAASENGIFLVRRKK